MGASSSAPVGARVLEDLPGRREGARDVEPHAGRPLRPTPSRRNPMNPSTRCALSLASIGLGLAAASRAERPPAAHRRARRPISRSPPSTARRSRLEDYAGKSVVLIDFLVDHLRSVPGGDASPRRALQGSAGQGVRRARRVARRTEVAGAGEQHGQKQGDDLPCPPRRGDDRWPPGTIRSARAPVLRAHRPRRLDSSQSGAGTSPATRRRSPSRSRRRLASSAWAAVFARSRLDRRLAGSTAPRSVVEIGRCAARSASSVPA